MNLSRNFGQHNALLAGVRAARYEVIVTLDDDFQNPPEEIRGLLAALADDVDLVTGRQPLASTAPGAIVASPLLRTQPESAVGSEMAAVVSPFRALRRRRHGTMF